MIPKRVLFWSDQQQVSESERDLLSQYRDDIEREILEYGSDDAESPAPGQFLTNLPRPIIGRVMARWVFLNDEEALVTGIRTGETEFEIPPED
jgi:hypothetical protein